MVLKSEPCAEARAACRHQSDRQSKGEPGTEGRKLPKQKDVPQALHGSKVAAPERGSKVAVRASGDGPRSAAGQAIESRIRGEVEQWMPPPFSCIRS